MRETDACKRARWLDRALLARQNHAQAACQGYTEATYACSKSAAVWHRRDARPRSPHDRIVSKAHR
jgi:hypothetical protein